MVHYKDKKVIWTIGHSTHSLEGFINLLNTFNIKILADIRSYPGSRHCPQFNKESFEISLLKEGIRYIHFEKLGGRRKARPGSVNNAWKHSSFRGYADYMESESFKDAIAALEKLALSGQTAYMCAEALWWRCHRSMISDWLKLNGWTVTHIMSNGKSEEHKYTQPARIVDGKLVYSVLPVT